MRLLFLISLSLITFLSSAQNTAIQYLSGLDKDQTVEWDFKVSGGRNSGEWNKIPVPSNWEMQGFGTYRYWSDWYENPVPDSVGNYRYAFDVSDDWKEKVIQIVFGGSMTDTEVKINGQLAGPIHQGGFYEFRYDISDLLKYGEENLLEVKVNRYSSNRSINLAERRTDFWMFSGIYRPVSLEAYPREHIARVAVHAKHEGDFSVDVFLGNINTAGYRVEGTLETLSGDPVGNPFESELKKDQKKVTLSTKVSGITPWTAERPTMYRVKLALKKETETVHQVTEKFGFRTIEVRKGDGIYVNNKKVILKGVNRHSFWPTSGRTTSKSLSIQDVNLIKDMNMNAVRMSHYPPDAHFLDVTDSLGLYVIDELTGWQDAYDTEVGKKLVPELIHRDVNHPSIILWANGNEGGWNYEVDQEFHKYDPQKRTVIHPWENFGDINTSHYEVYDCCTGSFFHGSDLFLPTEFLHGLFDGGHGAGLDDWWKLMMSNPLAAGGFLWAFADEGIVRDDLSGKIDVAGNSAPDGIVGPYREKEGSFYTIKEVWSPIYLEMSEMDVLPKTFDGSIKVENRYDHTPLDQVTFDWQFVDLPDMNADQPRKSLASGSFKGSAITPHETRFLSFDLPDNWQDADVFYLKATDPHGREVYTWSWMVSDPVAPVPVETKKCKKAVKGYQDGASIVMEACGVQVRIDSKTGKLVGVENNRTAIPLGQGPRTFTDGDEVVEITHKTEDKNYSVYAKMKGEMQWIHWTLHPDGGLRLKYAYRTHAKEGNNLVGVTFDFPEEQVKGVKWMGKGPYRVWKNRTKGVEFDVWQKDYNQTITGLDWDYPEFKGFHSQMYWATLQTKEEPFSIVFTDPGMYLQLFAPDESKEFDHRTTHVDFPEGDLSILRGIAPIGTKFHTAEEHGPAGAPNYPRRHGEYFEDEVWFYFGE